MAGIGLKYPVIAQFSAHTAGSEPTYLAGMFMGKARQVDLNIERSNNPLRGDDEDCENDNSITAMTMTQKNIPKMLQRRTVPVGLSSNSLLLE